MNQRTRVRVKGKTYDNKEVIKDIKRADVRLFSWSAGAKAWEALLEDHEIDEVFEEVKEATRGECFCEIAKD